ncbi:MAG: hypothetical protein HUU50_05400 [Candidatus Brocadiae bacterium]|nr:hypothetical protein [Candidatus Brocadiia bacterium]
MSILEKERKKLLETLPLPLACSYQEMLLDHALWKKGKGEKEKVVWKWMETSQLLLKIVSLLSLSNYLDLYQEDGDWELHRAILDCLKEPKTENHAFMAQCIIQYLKANPSQDNKLQGLSCLLEYSVNIEYSSAENFLEELPSKKAYSWFEIVSCLTKAEESFKSGEHKLQMPSDDFLDFHIDLLEIALRSCSFFQDYGIYVLVSRDERKTRGFICQGTKSKPMGIRWISATEWNALKGRPFFCLEGQKQYLPLFPFVVPLLHKHGERTAFSDLLLYEYGTNEKIIYHGYRSGKLYEHDECAQGALALWQKMLRSLDRNAPKSIEKKIKKNEIECASSSSFLNRKKLLDSLSLEIATLTSGYLYIQSQNGYGKTAFLKNLYCEEQRKSLSQEQGKEIFWVWYFLSSSYPYEDPVDIFVSFYVQIWEKVYQKSQEEIQVHLQKLPLGLQNLEKSFPVFLAECSKEILVPNSQKLVIVMDGMDSLDPFSTGYASLQCVLQEKLPSGIFFLLTWHIQESSASWLKGISLLQFCTKYNVVKEVPGSPLTKFSYSDIVEWLSNPYFNIPEHRIDQIARMVWEKSEQGDPLCLALLEHTLKNFQSYWEYWPSGRYGLMKRFWENLPEQENFIYYRFLLILSVLQEPANDFMMASILDASLSSIQKLRWHLNPVLRYQKKGYIIAYSEFREYIQSTLSADDKKDLHRSLILYYTDKGTIENYSSLSKEALQYLAYHYYHGGDFSGLFSIVLEESFQKEKQSRFTTVHGSLKDISLALKHCLEVKKYEQILKTGYQYYSISLSSVKGIDQAFRSAAHGDYALALEKLHLLQDEYDLFRGLLLVLWYTISNGDHGQSYRILEEFKRIPDEHIGFYASGLSNSLTFLLEKLQQHGIARIDTLIGKHGLTGQDAIDYLLGLAEKIHFTQGQVRYFLEVLIHSAMKLKEDEKKYSAVEKILSFWKEVEAYEPSSELASQIFMLAISIEDKIYQSKSWKLLTKAAISFNNKDYLLSIKNHIVKQVYAMQSQEKSSSFALGLYALLMFLHQEESLCHKIMEKALEKTQKETCQDWYLFLCHVLPELEETRENPGQRGLWEKILLCHEKNMLQSKGGHEEYKSRCTEKIAASMILFANSSQAFSLLQKDTLFIMEERKNSLKKILQALPAIPENEFMFSWNMLLGQTERFLAGKEQWELMEDLARFLVSKKMPVSDLQWSQYLLILDKKTKDPNKEKILSLLAYSFAKDKQLTKAQSMLSKITVPELKCAPLTEIALQLALKNEWEGALETIQEIPYVKEKFSIFSLIAEKIAPGDSGRSDWKKLTMAMLKASEKAASEKIPMEYWKKILMSLARDLPWEECIPIWKDIFKVLEKVQEQNQKEVLEEMLSLLAHSEDYEKTAFFWPVLQSLCEKMSFCNQSQIHSKTALTMAKLSKLREADNYLQKAILIAQKEPNKMNMLLSLGEIVSAYRYLGKEEESRKTFHLILKQTGLEDGKNSMDWNPDVFAIQLARLGLEDMACQLSEKLLILSVETKEEVPLPEALCLMADLCVQAGKYDWATFLFFRLLPVLSKDYGNITQEVPLYLRLIAILEKMAVYEKFHELWEYMEQMVLNFPKAIMQERCLEKLALTLCKHGFYHEHSALWEKLLQDAMYVGGKTESLKSLLRIGKYFIQAAPWEAWQKKYFSSEPQGIHLFREINRIPLEYEKIHLTEMVAEMLICSPDFQEIQKIWQELMEIPYTWQREDCTALALFQFAKILARHIEKKETAKMLEALLDKIPRLQTKGKAYFSIAMEYKEKGRKKEAIEYLHKSLKIAQKEEEKQKTTREILLALVSLGEEDFVYSEIASFAPVHKIAIEWELIREYIQKQKYSQAENLLKEAIATIPEIPSTNGEQTKAYSLAFLYQTKLKGFATAMPFLAKSLDTWDKISNSSYKKEAISFLLEQIKASSIASIPEELQTCLINKAESIEQEIYRIWAMQEIAETLTHYNQFDYILKVIQYVPTESEVKFRLLAIYATGLIKNNRIDQAFSMLALWKSYLEKLIFLKNLAHALSEKGDLDSLFRLYLFMPGDFSVLCYLTTRILSVVLEKQGKEAFEKWFTMISPFWGLAYNLNK